MSTMLYSAELWPLSVTQKKKLGSSTPQVLAKNTGHLLKEQILKQRSQREDNTAETDT